MAQFSSSRSSQHSQSTGILLSNVSHGFDGTAVLTDITLTVSRGETLVVIGPSGTGKTTLIRLLALFDSPDSGRILVGDTNLWSLSTDERLAARRRIGMVFQEPNLFEASVQRNVSYGHRVRLGWRARLRQWARRLVGDSSSPVVEETLEVVGLADAARRSTGSLSGGEAQRVAFARALAYDPEFLLLDEPTSDLDPRNTAVIEQAVETARDDGLGVVVATHDMQQAERIADRVAVLLDGRLIEVGPTEEVFTNPEDRRTQRFIDGELLY
jgi:tungstate transport system ATP-binding protein